MARAFSRTLSGYHLDHNWVEGQNLGELFCLHHVGRRSEQLRVLSSTIPTCKTPT